MHKKINATTLHPFLRGVYPLLAINSRKNSNGGDVSLSREKIYSIPICCYFSSNKSTCLHLFCFIKFFFMFLFSGTYGNRQVLSVQTNGPFTHVFNFSDAIYDAIFIYLFSQESLLFETIHSHSI